MSPGAAPSAIFDMIARPLLLVHAVAGFAAVGATTHFATYALLSVGNAARTAQLRRFATITPLVLGAQLLLGFALYPAYRVHVRLADFDRHAPALAQLFDFKEHLAALSLALIVAAAVVGRSQLRPAEGEAARARAVRKAIAALAASGALLVWFAALAGLYLTARHPVGTP